MQIVICGGGNAAHTLAGLLASQKNHSVHIYLSFAIEARQWKEGLKEQGAIGVLRNEEILHGKPDVVSTDPGEAIPGSKLILLALPAFAHEIILLEIAPYLEADTWVGALPARGCFDLCARHVLKDNFSKVVLFGLQTLPWACRILRYGREAKILGTKASVDISTLPASKADEIAQALGSLLGLTFNPVASFLSLTLAGTGQLIHPGIMYGLFRNWNGQSFDEAPLFYQGVDAYTSDILQAMSDEVQSISARIEDTFPSVDLSAVRPLAEWLHRSYEKDIANPTSLQTSFVTNRGYAGLKAAMCKINDGLAPDFQSRYLTEDVPNSLVPTRGIAELAGIPTPTIDQIIYWAQEQMGKEYLINGRLHGRDINETRAPQRYGITALQELIFLEKATNQVGL